MKDKLLSLKKYLFALLIPIAILGIIGISKVNAAQTQKIYLHFINVGQADSILVQQGNYNMLVDAGTTEATSTIVNYLKSHGVKKLDYVIATHPHEDHIGGMATVIKDFGIGKIYAPKVTTTTVTFKNFMEAIQAKKLSISVPTPGTSFKLGTATCQIIAPNSGSYEDLNNYSAVLKITYGKNTFLLTGDAQTQSEQEMLAKKFNLKADVLKVGHHGSNTSTSASFLKAVSPKYAIISVGKGNVYDHPSKATLDKLAEAKIAVYRTDQVGTIVVTSDGKTITIDKKASAIKTTAPPIAAVKSNSNAIVYITKTGKCYHKAGCKCLKSSKISIKLKDALKRGYKPCKICKPPMK